MIDTLITCSTVLLLAGGLYHFANRFLTTARSREQALAAAIRAEVSDIVAAVEQRILEANHIVGQRSAGILDDLNKFKDDFKADIRTLTENQVKLETNQKNLNAAVSIGTPARGSLLQQVMNAAKPAQNPADHK